MNKSKYLGTDLRLHGALTPFGVFKDLPNFDNALEKVFDGFDNYFKPLLDLKQDDMSYPPSNTKKTDTGYIVELALAGYNKEDISVTQEDDILTIAATKQRNEEKNEEDNYIYRGISFKSFSRSFKLGKSAEVTDISLTNGLLSVTVTESKPEKTKLTHKIK